MISDRRLRDGAARICLVTIVISVLGNVSLKQNLTIMRVKRMDSARRGARKFHEVNIGAAAARFAQACVWHPSRDFIVLGWSVFRAELSAAIRLRQFEVPCFEPLGIAGLLLASDVLCLTRACRTIGRQNGFLSDSFRLGFASQVAA